MRTFIVIALLGAAGCSGSGYDPDSSRAFRAAWEKRRAGDEAGYRAALAEVAKKHGTWAGDRAAIDLELMDEPRVSGWANLMRHAASFVRGTMPTPPVAAPTPEQ